MNLTRRQSLTMRLGAVACTFGILSILLTASPFQVASCAPVKATVDGDGYLRLARAGRAVYAKSAVLTVAANGKVSTPAGDQLLPTISAPTTTSALQVDLEGNVYAIRSEGKAKVGRIVLALFAEGQALEEKDGVLQAVDRPQLGNPGEDTNGVIRIEAASGVIVKSSSPIVIAPDPKTEPSPKKPDPKVEPATQEPKAKPANKPANARPKLFVSGTVEVAGDKILLSEIANIDADAATQQLIQTVDLGDAPTFGAKRVIDRAKVLAKLKLAGIEPESIDILIPATITVTKKGQTIEHDEFVKAALKAIYESPGIATEYVADSVGPEFVAPAGPRALVVETISGINTMVATVKVAVFVGPKRINSRTVSLKAKAIPMTLKTGSPVKVHFRAGGAVVEVSGIVRSAGRPGDSIQVDVRLPGSEKTSHVGKVLADGSVEVKI